jgi:hypothetical protein
LRYGRQLVEALSDIAPAARISVQRPFHLSNALFLHFNIDMEALDMGLAGVFLACRRRF